MISVVFNGCAGWLHPANPDRALGRTVILCESFGYEGLCAQRAVMALAEMLADAGMPTLRFHYRGTGDSADDEEPGQIDRWIGSIGDAIRFMRETTGVAEVALAGLRLGGLLAVEAARRHGDVAALALLAPVMWGRNYARELMLGGSMVSDRREAPMPEDWIEMLGYRLHESDLAQLRRLDLRKDGGAGAAARMLLLAPETELPDFGAQVEVRQFLHYDGLATHTELIYVPMKAFGETVAWLAEGAPPAPHRAPPLPAPPVLEVSQNIVERPIYFGRGEGRFGVMCQRGAARHECAVLILNTGMNHHTGNGRCSVRLARRLARSGVTSFRIDMDKIGDSLPIDPEERVGFHDKGRVADVRAALDVLQQAGHTKVLVTGICAGAYVGLHAASVDRRITGAVLVNLPYFYVEEEDPDVPLWRKPMQMGARFLNQTRRWRTAWHLNHGSMPGRQVFSKRRLQAAMKRLHYGRLWLRQSALTALRKIMPGGWVIGRTDRLIWELYARGVDLTFAFSGGDLSLREMRMVFGEGGKRMLQNGWAKLVLFDSADHAVTMTFMQGEYAGLIEEQLGLHANIQAQAWSPTEDRRRAPRAPKSRGTIAC